MRKRKKATVCNAENVSSGMAGEYSRVVFDLHSIEMQTITPMVEWSDDGENSFGYGKSVVFIHLDKSADNRRNTSF